MGMVTYAAATGDKCSACFASGDGCRYCPDGNPAVLRNWITWDGPPSEDGCITGRLHVKMKNGKIFVAR